MKKSQFLYIVLISFIALSRGASAEETVSLHSLIEEAEKNNPTLTALRLRQESAKEEIRLAPFLDDPALTVTQWGVPRDFNIGRSNETWLGIEQTFPYPGKRRLKREIATIDWEIANERYQAKRLEIAAEIKSAYYNLALIIKTIDLHQEHQALLKEFVKVAETRYALGHLTQQDLLKAEVELAKLHNSKMALEQDQISTKAKINALVGRNDSYPMGMPAPVSYRPFILLYETITEEALRNQRHLKSALFRVQQSEAMKTLTNKATLPDFTIGIAYWDIHGDENQWMAMGKINLPWVFGEKYHAKNRKAALEVTEAMANYNGLKNETLSQIKTIFTKIKTDEQLIDSYQNKLIPLAKQSLTVAQDRYQSGRGDFLNFIDSERTLLDLQMEYYMTLTDYWQQVAMLSPLIGKEVNP